LGDKFLVFRVQVAEVGKLPITTVYDCTEN
jgi:hypothetical protein